MVLPQLSEPLVQVQLETLCTTRSHICQVSLHGLTTPAIALTMLRTGLPAQKEVGSVKS